MLDTNGKELKLGDKVVCALAANGHVYAGVVTKFYFKTQYGNKVERCSVGELTAGSRTAGTLANVSPERVMKIE